MVCVGTNFIAHTRSFAKRMVRAESNKVENFDAVM